MRLALEIRGVGEACGTGRDRVVASFAKQCAMAGKGLGIDSPVEHQPVRIGGDDGRGKAGLWSVDPAQFPFGETRRVSYGLVRGMVSRARTAFAERRRAVKLPVSRPTLSIVPR